MHGKSNLKERLKTIKLYVDFGLNFKNKIIRKFEILNDIVHLLYTLIIHQFFDVKPFIDFDVFFFES
ncbi:hypothetical protein BpHYR1_015266 [Brachionus plicatilis]|uniref:Uncharacterized protein n=1 Tax=Brachionus plicatilis TaxID=10195 RepID=A0A3M7Q4D8_BRAPC|nr:hypothetical protein BpHYR1_015266 [Brachionus plicatilis]